MTQSGRSPTLFVLTTILIDTMGFGIVLPVLPQLVMTLSHVGLAEATRIGGWLLVAYALPQFLMAPVMGNLSDHFGRRPVLLISLIGFAVNYLLMAFAPTLAWLFIGRVITGICGAVPSTAMAALADSSSAENRARAFGLAGAGFGVGFILGPAIGGLLGELGPRAPFYAAAAIAGINFVYGSFFFPETLAPERRRCFELRRANPLGALMSVTARPGILPLAVAAVFWTFAMQVYPATWSFFTIERFGWSPGVIGASLAYTGLTLALVQGLFIGRIVEKIGEHRAAIIGVATGIAGFIGFLLIREGWMVFAVMTVIAVQGLAFPSMNAMMSQKMSADTQGELQGLTTSINALTSIAGPLVLNESFAYFTDRDAPVYFPGAAFAIATLAAFVTLIILIRSRQRPGEAL